MLLATEPVKEKYPKVSYADLYQVSYFPVSVPLGCLSIFLFSYADLYHATLDFSLDQQTKLKLSIIQFAYVSHGLTLVSTSIADSYFSSSISLGSK